MYHASLFLVSTLEYRLVHSNPLDVRCADVLAPLYVQSTEIEIIQSNHSVVGSIRAPKCRLLSARQSTLPEIRIAHLTNFVLLWLLVVVVCSSNQYTQRATPKQHQIASKQSSRTRLSLTICLSVGFVTFGFVLLVVASSA